VRLNFLVSRSVCRCGNVENGGFKQHNIKACYLLPYKIETLALTLELSAILLFKYEYDDYIDSIFNYNC